VFEGNHGFSLSQTGLSFLGIFVGLVLGTASDPIWRRNYRRLARNHASRLEAQGKLAPGEEPSTEPEWRLPPTIAGAVVVPIALFGEWISIILCCSTSGVSGKKDREQIKKSRKEKLTRETFAPGRVRVDYISLGKLQKAMPRRHRVEREDPGERMG
jgi:hypothetical protein